MKDHYYVIIMAGGGGTRLWPVSLKSLPKQMLRIEGNRSLFQLAIERLRGQFPPERIFIVTVQDQIEMLRNDCPDLPYDNFIIEPLPRGTASVVGLAASILNHKDKQAVMAVLTADHVIKNIDLFRQLLENGFEVSQSDYLVTLGIEPTYPATGYGYIESGEELDNNFGFVSNHVKRFIEKPNEENARRFLEKGNYYWNSGMFIWRVNRILDEFRKQMPVLSETLDLISSAIDTPQFDEILNSHWVKITPQTIDYGIMEHAEKVAVLPAKGLGWSDVGSWDSLFDFLKTDEYGNVIIGDNNYIIDVKNSLINNVDSKRVISVIGTSDLIIVNSKDALLVCKRGESQQVRQMIERLKKNNLDNYL